jgi:pyruvate formate lyase activating enzyme
LLGSTSKPIQGLILNIQRFSIQDGPGIRTTVFFKGCPLECAWCSNPESIHPFPEIMLHDVNCIRCGNCVVECPQGASQIINDRRVIDCTRCSQCMQCVGVCTAQAIECAGEWKNIPEIISTVLRDAAYYNSTGGGLTLSGGEPLWQWRFARELAKAAHANGLHVALDTTGYAPWKAFSSALEYVDLVLYDLKHMDPARHRAFTGVPNGLILKNLGAILRETQATVWVRIPVIPTFNNTSEAIVAMGAFIRALPRQVEKVSILPFHQYGAGKYAALGRPYRWSDQKIDSDERLQEIKQLLTTFDLNVDVGR